MKEKTEFVQTLQNEIPGLFKNDYFSLQGLKSEISLIKQYHYYLSDSNKIIKLIGTNKVQHKSMQRLWQLLHLKGYYGKVIASLFKQFLMNI